MQTWSRREPGERPQSAPDWPDWPLAPWSTAWQPGGLEGGQQEDGGPPAPGPVASLGWRNSREETVTGGAGWGSMWTQSKVENQWEKCKLMFSLNFTFPHLSGEANWKLGWNLEPAGLKRYWGAGGSKVCELLEHLLHLCQPLLELLLPHGVGGDGTVSWPVHTVLVTVE